MIRLGLLIVVTLAVIGAGLAWLGQGDLRQPQAAAPVSAAEDAGAPALTAPVPAAPLPAQPPVEVVPATTQTPARVSEFPGPPLEPSPEYGDGAPPAVATADGAVLYVTATRVNMRSGPGTDNPVVAGLEGGAAVTPVGPADGEWVQVRTASGQDGFVASQFLSPTR